MPTLADFMESLTQEQDKLVQMGAIKSNKDQSLEIVVSNQGKGNKNAMDSKQHGKKKENPKPSDGGSNPRKYKGKK